MFNFSFSRREPVLGEGLGDGCWDVLGLLPVMESLDKCLVDVVAPFDEDDISRVGASHGNVKAETLVNCNFGFFPPCFKGDVHLFPFGQSLPHCSAECALLPLTDEDSNY